MYRIKMNHKQKVSCLLVGLVMMLYGAYQFQINQALELVSIPVASRYLMAGTKISQDDIKYISIPKAYLSEGVVVDENRIVEHYIKNYSALAKDSLFYEEIISLSDNLEDQGIFHLKENEVAISLDVDMKKTYANAIRTGHFIDVYYQGYTKDKRAIYGALVNQVRVIGVKDKSGLEVTRPEKQSPAVLVLALAYSDADLIQRAKFFGEILPIISFDTLNQKESEFYDKTKLKNIIFEGSYDVSVGADD